MRKHLLATLSALFVTVCAMSQSNEDYGLSEEWTRKEINSANTAQNERYLSQEERNVFLWVNLARMYPQKFARCEVEPYMGEAMYGYQYSNGNSYKASLLNHLRTMKPVNPIYNNLTLYSLAREWAVYSGQDGTTGHSRPWNLAAKRNKVEYFGECCDYGHNVGKEIVMSLLIDNTVQNLGHRKNLLSTEWEFDRMGVSIQSHAKFRDCCVIDLSLRKYVD